MYLIPPGMSQIYLIPISYRYSVGVSKIYLIPTEYLCDMTYLIPI